MVPVADPFVRVYVLVDEALGSGAVPIPSRHGRPPTCSDAEVLPVVVARHLLARPSERGFLCATWTAAHRVRGPRVITTPDRAERRTLPLAVRRPEARLRNRIETTTGELIDARGLARHGAKAVWGLLTRAAATMLAHTLLRLTFT